MIILEEKATGRRHRRTLRNRFRRETDKRPNIMKDTAIQHEFLFEMYAFILPEGTFSLGETRDSVVKSSGRGSRSTRWSTVTGTS
jgi:hypothetical protein